MAVDQTQYPEQRKLLIEIARHFRLTDHWEVTSDGPRHIKEPLRVHHLDAHVDGTGPRIGLCPVGRGESTTRVSLLDFDSHRGETSWPDMLAVANKVADALRARGYLPVMWRSSGGSGIHLYVFWSNPQDAYSVREMLREVLAECGLKNGTGGVAAGEAEIFPKQSQVPKDGWGSMAVLPWAGKSELLDPEELPEIPHSPDVPLVAKPERVKSTSTPVELQELKRMLDAIPNDDLGYDSWFRIVAGIHSVDDGPDGLALAHAWSGKSSKHNAEWFEEQVWPYLRERENAIGIGTLKREAFKHGYEDLSVLDDFDNIDEVALREFKQEVGVRVLVDDEPTIEAFLAQFVAANPHLHPEAAAIIEPFMRAAELKIELPPSGDDYDYDLGQLRAVEYAIDEFNGNGITVIAGAAGVGKTSLLVPLAAAVAHLYDSGIKVELRRKVVYITEAPEQVERILYGLRKHAPGARSPAEFKEWFKIRRACRMDPKTLAKVTAKAVKDHTVVYNGYPVAPLIVLDTSNATIDLDNENDNSEVGRALSEIKVNIGTGACWLITHLAKALNRKNVDEMTARGAGAFGGDANSTAFVFEDEKLPGKRFLAVKKVRFEMAYNEIAFETKTYSETVLTAWGTMQSTTYRVGFPERSSRAARLAKAEESKVGLDARCEEKVLNYVREAEAKEKPELHSATSLEKVLRSGRALGMTRDEFRAALARLRATNRLTERNVPADQRHGGLKMYLSAVGADHDDLGVA